MEQDKSILRISFPFFPFPLHHHFHLPLKLRPTDRDQVRDCLFSKLAVDSERLLEGATVHNQLREAFLVCEMEVWGDCWIEKDQLVGGVHGVGAKGDEEAGDVGQEEGGEGPREGLVKVEVQCEAVLHSQGTWGQLDCLWYDAWTGKELGSVGSSNLIQNHLSCAASWQLSLTSLCNIIYWRPDFGSQEIVLAFTHMRWHWKAFQSSLCLYFESISYITCSQRINYGAVMRFNGCLVPGCFSWQVASLRFQILLPAFLWRWMTRMLVRLWQRLISREGKEWYHWKDCWEVSCVDSSSNVTDLLQLTCLFPAVIQCWGGCREGKITRKSRHEMLNMDCRSVFSGNVDHLHWQLITGTLPCSSSAAQVASHLVRFLRLPRLHQLICTEMSIYLHATGLLQRLTKVHSAICAFYFCVFYCCALNWYYRSSSIPISSRGTRQYYAVWLYTFGKDFLLAPQGALSRLAVWGRPTK